jgi:hypothetical protein
MRGGHYVWYAAYKTYVPLTHWPGGNEAGEQFEVSFDEMGLRNPTQSLARADVLVLGDSFIAADNTPVEHTLVACPRTVQRSRHAPHARPNGRGLAHDMQSSFYL